MGPLPPLRHVAVVQRNTETARRLMGELQGLLIVGGAGSGVVLGERASQQVGKFLALI